MSNTKQSLRAKRKKRIRQKISGTASRPRLSVFRSARHINAQVIDDESGKTVVSVNSYKKGQPGRADKEACAAIGKSIAEMCLAKDIKSIVFDKNGYAYHGRVKALADGEREGGLQF